LQNGLNLQHQPLNVMEKERFFRAADLVGNGRR